MMKRIWIFEFFPRNNTKDIKSVGNNQVPRCYFCVYNAGSFVEMSRDTKRPSAVYQKKIRA